MSVTAIFFSAQTSTFLHPLQKWLNAENDEDEKFWHNELYTLHSHADFSFHIHWPEDIDVLCQLLLAEGLNVPNTCSSFLMKEVWSDEESVWVDLISPTFPLAIATLSDDGMQHIIEHWAQHLTSEDSTNHLYYQDVHKNVSSVLWDLRIVSQDILRYSKDMLLLRIR
ncbi:hypothetical protein KDA_66640 [Dictyobacter alpinus]|uniref:Uncharacterized protein n=1 Tax=Dictyobacter alpinus TaxID=2014873 RepID=A0A402BIL4_9CHLR|nr:hypothetical protein [Dictyobacter alpinus]GCE31180.1 hypothetical protein KDA_66640 [Dictyobacter alpinus]